MLVTVKGLRYQKLNEQAFRYGQVFLKRAFKSTLIDVSTTSAEVKISQRICQLTSPSAIWHQWSSLHLLPKLQHEPCCDAVSLLKVTRSQFASVS